MSRLADIFATLAGFRCLRGLPARLLTLVVFTLFVNSSVAAAQSDTVAVGSVTGSITNGTVASTVPADLKITLVVSQQGAAPQQFTATSAADGSFIFTSVPIIPAADYVAATLYRDRIFSSTFVNGSAAPINLPITIYELTEDPAVLSIIGTVIQVSQGKSTLEFRQVIRFRNTSDRIFTSTQDMGNGRYASLVIPLPPGAQVISFDNPDRYVISQAKFTIIDTNPVFPGDDNQILVIYILPYDGTTSLIEQPFNYPFNGQARLLLWPGTMGMKSNQFSLADKETLADHEYQAYGATLQLIPGDIIRYEIGGGAVQPAAQSAVTANNSGLVLLIVIVLSAAAVGVLFVLRIRQPTAPTTVQYIDALTRQIDALDQKHAAGQLNHDLWHRRRAPLQARLKQLRGEEDSD